MPAADSTRAGHRWLTRLLALVLLTFGAVVGLAGPASAHNVLIASDPTEGATLQQSPTTVRLTFDQPVQDFEPIVTVVGPDGQRYESGAPVVDSTVVSAAVGALPVAGAYVVAYRVVSADGHPVQGEVHFELAATAVGTSPAAASSAPASAPASSSAASVGSTAASSAPPVQSSAAAATTTSAVAPAAESSGLAGWMWAAIAVAAVLVAAAIVVIVRRPRQQ